MAERVVVLGAGYAGTGAVQRLEAALPASADLTWISREAYHLLLHESHRCIRDPAVTDSITIPAADLKSASTTFLEDTVMEVDTDAREVHREGGEPVPYDYLVVALGTRTAFFGVEGLREHAHTLKNLEDAVGIHEAVLRAAGEASPDSPARVVVGGAGLSGIQAAGELAVLRDEADLPVEIALVEGLSEILPGRDADLQAALRQRLEARNVQIRTGEFVGAVDADTVYVGEDGELSYEVLIWTGGITGRTAIERTDVGKDERTHRIDVGRDFRTDDDRIFAIGDAAIVDQPGEEPAPPTAQAAWQAAEVAGANVASAIRGESLEEWHFEDKGMVISVGESAVAHDVYLVPVVETFGGLPAKLLKKAIAARWIKDVAGYRRAIRAWPDL